MLYLKIKISLERSAAEIDRGYSLDLNSACNKILSYESDVVKLYLLKKMV